MLNHSKSKSASSSHRILMDNAKNRLNDLQERFSDIQAARKEGRISDLAVLEEQVYQSIREWQAELNAPSPASSFPAGSIGSFSDEIARLLQLYDEEDDATSALKEPPAMKPEAFNKSPGPTESLVLKPEAFSPNVCSSEQVESKPESFNQHRFYGNISTAKEGFPMDTRPQHNEFPGFHQCNSISSDLDDLPIRNLDITAQLDYHLLNMHQELNHGLLTKSDGVNECVKDTNHSIQQNICLPPSAFLGPKCALWDCTRPAQGSEWYHSYCSSFHANLAPNENSPGMSPIVRPGGISLKDNLLLDALRSKTQGKNVGIPECEGAVNTKCPWNATELFNLSLVEGETVREWLFFDKPRRAFESGNRKQRSLPDYNGRGWHESRKQMMKEWGGHKRSYYMDPQPPGPFEWHLFEYQINECADCALYRLELKLTNGKKSPKGKAAKDPLVDLQKKMGRLTAEVSSDKPPPNMKGDTKAGGTSQQVNFHDGKVNLNPVHDSGSSAADQIFGQPSQIR